MLLSHSKRFMFFHIPKTAGTSVRLALAEHSEPLMILKQNFDPININQIHAKKFVSLPTDYKEFVIVREPLTRLISVFRYGNNPSKFGTFSNFCQRMKEHYTRPFLTNFYDSQLSWIENSITGNIKVFKLEDLSSLGEYLEIENFELPRENVNPINIDITPEERNFCLEFLKKEYEILGY